MLKNKFFFIVEIFEKWFLMVEGKMMLDFLFFFCLVMGVEEFVVVKIVLDLGWIIIGLKN